MDNLLIFISNAIIQTFLCGYTVYSISKFFVSEPFSKKQNILLIITSLLGVTFSLIVKEYIPAFNIMTCIVVFVLISHFVLKITWLKSLLIAVLSMTYTAITEIICFFIGMIIFKADVAELTNQPLISIALSLLQCILSFVVLNALHFVTNKKTNIQYVLGNISYKQVLAFTIALVLCIFPQMIIFVLTDYSYPTVFLIINSLQFILICIFLFVYLKKSVEHEKTQSDLFTSELHNKTLVGMVDGVRTLKHDYNNIMQALNGYVSTKQYDKLQNHINGVLEECNIVNSLAVIDPKIFNDPAIYGIVGSKFFLANEQNLPFEFDIVTNIAEIQYPMTNGRNTGEILRLLDALQLTDKESVSTPANWIPGSSVITPSPKTSEEMFSTPANNNCIDWYLCYNSPIHTTNSNNNFF